MENNTGTLFKEIRRNKNFSQEFIARGVLTQSAYSKFELGKNEISYSSYIPLSRMIIIIIRMKSCFLIFSICPSMIQNS
jgi:transcriptional regulator with XRE-family HTH domain